MPRRENSTLFSGRGFAIWVMSPQGVFYTGDHLQGQFHHSSFLGGPRVAAAGEWAVNKGGQLVFVNHKTGHYYCTPHQLYNAMGKLRDDMKMDVSQTACRRRRSGWWCWWPVHCSRNQWCSKSSMEQVSNLFIAEMLTVLKTRAGHFEKNTGDGLMGYFEGPFAESTLRAAEAAIVPATDRGELDSRPPDSVVRVPGTGPSPAGWRAAVQKAASRGQRRHFSTEL